MSTGERESLSTPLKSHSAREDRVSFALTAAVLTAMAGGMGWGIRGQYGHETGAMIAGVLVGFTLVLFFLPQATSLTAARVVALTAIGISFGGSMTYGQTIGLTHDAPLIGNYAALRWGLLGLLIKGGIWIGFAGALLGMGLGGKRYRSLEFAMLVPTLFVLLYAGMWALNQPFDPANQVLPRIYFSDDWHWEPDSELRPRPENWGGLLLAFVGLTAYVHFVRKDRLARNMALVGFVAGALGFPLGQCVQAFHAWNPDLFQSEVLGRLEPYLRHINWWNMMETTFGAIFGFVLALGLWWNRHLIAQEDKSDEDAPDLSPAWELVLCVDHVILLVAAEFLEMRMLSLYISFGLIMSALPLMGVVGGRYWPYLFALPIVAVPIAGKTLRNLSYENAEVALVSGWIYFVVIPLAVALCAAGWLARKGKQGHTSRQFARIGLLLATWMYLGLNFAFFRVPWPWEAWTGRTPSGVIFAVCALSLTTAAVVLRDPARPM